MKGMFRKDKIRCGLEGCVDLGEGSQDRVGGKDEAYFENGSGAPSQRGGPRRVRKGWREVAGVSVAGLRTWLPCQWEGDSALEAVGNHPRVSNVAEA